MCVCVCVCVCVCSRARRTEVVGGGGGGCEAPVLKAHALPTLIKWAPSEQMKRTTLRRIAFCKVWRPCSLYKHGKTSMRPCALHMADLRWCSLVRLT